MIFVFVFQQVIQSESEEETGQALHKKYKAMKVSIVSEIKFFLLLQVFGFFFFFSGGRGTVNMQLVLFL